MPLLRKLEQWTWPWAVSAVFLYVVLRAVHVPTFHDEAATFFHYVVSGEFLPSVALWDANNHLLNSALSGLAYRLFGPEPLFIRLPNVLGFLVYAFYLHLITGRIGSTAIRFGVRLAVLMAAFALEFFSMARGYGMSLGFMLGACYHAGIYLEGKKLGQQAAAWLWMWLAVAANLALMNTYLVLLGLTALVWLTDFRRRWRHVLLWSVIGLPVAVAAALYGFELRGRGLLYTGFDDGFLDVTVRSLVRYQLGVESAAVAVVVTVIGVVASLWLLFDWLRDGGRWTLLRAVAALLLLNAIGSLLLNLLFGMNFPENRVALYYIPLFLLTVAAALDSVADLRPRAAWLALPFLFFPIHLIKGANLSTSILWPKWHGSEAVYQRAVELQQTIKRPLIISGHYLNELSWAYYNFLEGSPMPLMQREPVPDTLADLLIARPTDFDLGSIAYDTLLHDEANGIYLLKRAEGVIWSPPVPATVQRTCFEGNDEFYEFLNTPIYVFAARAGVFDLDAVLTVEGGVPKAHVITATFDADGQMLSYQYVQLHWISAEWNERPLRLRRTFHFTPETAHLKMYLWNIGRQQVSCSVERFDVIVLEAQ